MNNKIDPKASGRPDSRAVSAVGQTGNVGRSTGSGGAAKVFREFKWGLLTLFLLMAVVIGLVYDGGKKKKLETASKPPAPSIDTGALDSLPPPPTPHAPPAQPPGGNTGDLVASPGLPNIQPVPQPQPGPSPRVPDIGQRREGTVANDPGLTVIPPPSPLQPAPTYVVKPGDSLTKIATTLKLGKGGVNALVEANKDTIPDAHKIRVGMTLKVPTPVAPKIAAKPETGNAAGPGTGTEAKKDDYIVQAGDTLERIARKVLKDGKKWKDIYEWNRDQLADPGHLRVGQALRMKASGTPAAAQPGSARADRTPPAGEVVESPTPVAASSTQSINTRMSPDLP